MKSLSGAVISIAMLAPHRPLNCTSGTMIRNRAAESFFCRIAKKSSREQQRPKISKVATAEYSNGRKPQKFPRPSSNAITIGTFCSPGMEVGIWSPITSPFLSLNPF